MKRYPKVEDGEWVQPVTTGYGMACCDCGLVHRLNFRIHEGHIQFQASRDNRATGQIRRSRETIPWSTREWIATPNHPEAKPLRSQRTDG